MDNCEARPAVWGCQASWTTFVILAHTVTETGWKTALREGEKAYILAMSRLLFFAGMLD